MKTSSILLLYALGVLALLCGCKQVQYVPVERVRTDSVYMTKVQRDSIYKYDSVFVRERGDTVEVVKCRYLFVDKWRRDTMYVERIDTIRIPVPVERELSRWERVKQEAGGVAIGGFAVALLIIVGYIVYKSRRK